MADLQTIAATSTSETDPALVIRNGRAQWAESINIKDAKATEINDYITYKTIEYGKYKLSDDDLWGAFQDDFKGFTTRTFEAANSAGIRQLRATLRLHGV